MNATPDEMVPEDVGGLRRKALAAECHLLHIPLGPVDPSFRALSGRPKFTIRRHKFNKNSLSRSRVSNGWFRDLGFGFRFSV